MRTLLSILVLLLTALPCLAESAQSVQHLLYVAVPGIRDYPEYGGTGILVFDIDHGHKFVRRIAVPALGDVTKAKAAKGICASSKTGRLYVSTPRDLTCIDLTNDRVIWQKTYPNGCDRMSISTDGKTLYEPTLEGKYWHVIDAISGDEVGRIQTDSGSHNTIFGPDGRHVYLAGLHSPLLTVADAATRQAEGTVGPFAAPIRPFTVNSECTRVYVNVDGLLGFEVGDLTTGKKLWQVQVAGVSEGPTKRHGCPSHGIALTPDETEIWVTDAHNSRLHVFDNTKEPPAQIASIKLRDQPGWVTCSIDGRYVYPSTGDIIDAHSQKIVGELTDEHGQAVQSEKLMEIDFAGNRPTETGDQFGIGRKSS